MQLKKLNILSLLVVCVMIVANLFTPVYVYAEEDAPAEDDEIVAVYFMDAEGHYITVDNNSTFITKEKLDYSCYFPIDSDTSQKILSGESVTVHENVVDSDYTYTLLAENNVLTLKIKAYTYKPVILGTCNYVETGFIYKSQITNNAYYITEAKIKTIENNQLRVHIELNQNVNPIDTLTLEYGWYQNRIDKVIELTPNENTFEFTVDVPEPNIFDLYTYNIYLNVNYSPVDEIDINSPREQITTETIDYRLYSYIKSYAGVCWYAVPVSKLSNYDLDSTIPWDRNFDYISAYQNTDWDITIKAGGHINTPNTDEFIWGTSSYLVSYTSNGELTYNQCGKNILEFTTEDGIKTTTEMPEFTTEIYLEDNIMDELISTSIGTNPQLEHYIFKLNDNKYLYTTSKISGDPNMFVTDGADLGFTIDDELNIYQLFIPADNPVSGYGYNYNQSANTPVYKLQELDGTYNILDPNTNEILYENITLLKKTTDSSDWSISSGWEETTELNTGSWIYKEVNASITLNKKYTYTQSYLKEYSCSSYEYYIKDCYVLNDFVYYTTKNKYNYGNGDNYNILIFKIDVNTLNISILNPVGYQYSVDAGTGMTKLCSYTEYFLPGYYTGERILREIPNFNKTDEDNLSITNINTTEDITNLFKDTFYKNIIDDTPINEENTTNTTPTSNTTTTKTETTPTKNDIINNTPTSIPEETTIHEDTWIIIPEEEYMPKPTKTETTETPVETPNQEKTNPSIKDYIFETEEAKETAVNNTNSTQICLISTLLTCILLILVKRTA